MLFLNLLNLEGSGSFMIASDNCEVSFAEKCCTSEIPFPKSLLRYAAFEALMIALSRL